MNKLFFLLALLPGLLFMGSCVTDDDEVKEPDGDPVFFQRRLTREVDPGDSFSMTAALPFMMLDIYTMGDDRVDGVRLLPADRLTNEMRYRGSFIPQTTGLHWLSLYHPSSRQLEVKIDSEANDSVPEVWLYAIPLDNPYTTVSRVCFRLKKAK
jgi:hypothetical protein